MVAIDFSPGSHGHFLDYVVNAYIFNLDIKDINIFQSSGACHVINIDEKYQSFDRMTRHGHFTSFDIPYPRDIERIVWIKHDKKLDFVLLTNIWYRCHPGSMHSTDFNVNEITELHRHFIVNNQTDLGLRQDWFAKLNSGIIYTDIVPKSKLPIYEFNYASFFDLSDFLSEMRRLADWLGMTFVYDSRLANLWFEFIKRNQGWKAYSKTNQILSCVAADRSSLVDNDWQIHAFLNYKISKIFNLHDGVLFDREIYPLDSREIYAIIADHVKNFDSRF